MDYFDAAYFSPSYFATPSAPPSEWVGGSFRRRPAPARPVRIGDTDEVVLLWMT